MFSCIDLWVFGFSCGVLLLSGFVTLDFWFCDFGVVVLMLVFVFYVCEL